MSGRLDIPDGLDGYEEPRYEMVRTQIEARGVDDLAVLAAMRTVPRHLFVPLQQVVHAYDDTPLDIGAEQTVSQPYIVGLMTQSLALTGTERILEIGTGCGYQTAILARCAAQVVSVERIADLARGARRRLEELGFANVTIHEGDGSLGWPMQAPYDGILVTACAPALPPSLLAQVRACGRIVIPIGNVKNQALWAIAKRSETEVERVELCKCMFVLLYGAEGFDEADAGQ